MLALESPYARTQHRPGGLAADCLKLFRACRDTLQIAESFDLPEARVSRLIWAARCRERGRPAEFLQGGILKRIAPP